MKRVCEFLIVSFFCFHVMGLAGSAVWAAESERADETATPSDTTNGSGDQNQTSGTTAVDIQDLDLKQLLLLPLDYGNKESKVDLHVYLTTALWGFGDQAWGSYANEASSLSGRPTFITYSGYIDIRGNISKTVMAEAEFELYKGETGEFKVTRLRGVWKPSRYFQLVMGRDFPPIGVQDKIYYPTSRYRLIANAPYLYWSILRATGWWDSGVHVSGEIPVGGLSKDAKVLWNVSLINGPGDGHQTGPDYLLGKMVPNAQGYMYEAFHDKARQPWDNNNDKAIPVRLALVPSENFEVGGSFMFSKYDDDGDRSANYFFGHLLYGGERLTIASEYGELHLDVDPANMATAANVTNGTSGGSKVTQRSFYASGAYKIIHKKYGIHSLEPVFRYEFMDSWVQDRTDRGDRHAFWMGFRFNPFAGWTLKSAYLIQWEPEGPKLNNNGFVLESVFEF